jgi:hypothetical protein
MLPCAVHNGFFAAQTCSCILKEAPYNAFGGADMKHLQRTMFFAGFEALVLHKLADGGDVLWATAPSYGIEEHVIAKGLQLCCHFSSLLTIPFYRI